jgi:hypothetical protein
MEARASSQPSPASAATRSGSDRPHRLEGDHGAAVVEFALVLPILVVFLLGMISGGFLMNQRLQMAHAAREAARFGATIPTGQVFASGTWAEAVRDLAVERSAGDLEDADVCVSLVEGATPAVFQGDGDYSTNGTAPCIADDGAGDGGLRVQVTATNGGTLETGLWSREVTFEISATAKHESPSS